MSSLNNVFNAKSPINSTKVKGSYLQSWKSLTYKADFGWISDQLDCSIVSLPTAISSLLRMQC